MALTLVIALIGLIAMFLLPGGRADQYAYKPQEGSEEHVEAAGIEPLIG